jgi:hypothetical protein
LKKLQSPEPIHTKMPLIILLVAWDHGLYVYKPRSFPPNRALKMRESQQLFLRLRLVSEESQQSAIQTKIEHHFGGFFPEIKGRQSTGRNDSKQTVIPTSRRLD